MGFFLTYMVLNFSISIWYQLMCVWGEGGGISRGNLYQWIISNYISKLDTTLLPKILRLRFMNLSFTYMMFNLFIPAWCKTLPHTCTPSISSSNVSLYHMIDSLKHKSFSSTSILWLSLELTCSRYLHRHSTHGTYYLDPLPGISIERILSPTIQRQSILSEPISSQSISFDTNCYALRGENQGDLYQWTISNHINKLYTTLQPKTLKLKFMGLTFTYMILILFILTPYKT